MNGKRFKKDKNMKKPAPPLIIRLNAPEPCTPEPLVCFNVCLNYHLKVDSINKKIFSGFS